MSNPNAIVVETLTSGKRNDSVCAHCKNKIPIPLKVHQARQHLRENIRERDNSRLSKNSTPEIISIGKVQTSFKLRNPKTVANEVKQINNMKRAQRKIAKSFGKSKKHQLLSPTSR
jgi:hypothetical protein